MITQKSRIGGRLWVLTVLVILGGCRCRATEPLPVADIVFQTATGDARPYSLGFIQADGRDLQYVEVRPYSYLGGTPIYPVQTSDGNLLVFYGSRGATDPLSAITSEGYLIKYEDHYSGSRSRIAPVQGSHQAVIAEAYTGGRSKDIKRRIQLLDLDEKIAVQTYVTTTGVFIDIGANALQQTSLFYMRSREGGVELVLLNTETGKEAILLNENKSLSSPAISPNGRLVAYTAGDGIYVVSVEGGAARRVARACVEQKRSPGYIYWNSWPPAPSWSPDSQWLVYHRCTLPCSERCEDIEDYSIFKVNVETGEEVLLVEGGLNPYWRLDSGTAE